MPRLCRGEADRRLCPMDAGKVNPGEAALENSEEHAALTETMLPRLDGRTGLRKQSASQSSYECMSWENVSSSLLHFDAVS